MAVGQAACWGREEFWIVLADHYRTSYSSLVRLAAIYLDRAAEDAVQDAFVRVSLQWDSVRAADKVLPYLQRAVMNIAKAQLRRRRVALAPRRPMLWPATAPASEEEALRNLADDALVLAIRRLPRQQAACVGLRCYLNLSEKETAEVLDISPGSVKKHMSRARQKLASVLGASDE